MLNQHGALDGGEGEAGFSRAHPAELDQVTLGIDIEGTVRQRRLECALRRIETAQTL